MKLIPSPSIDDGRRAATVGVPVLASKLRAPLRSQGGLRRELIEHSIGSSPAAKVVLVRGPAGFGKTTTMLQHYEQLQSSGAAVAWLNLDDEDNDFERFLAYLSLIFDRLADADDAAGTSMVCEPATDLIYRIAGLDRPLTLFVDECEAIESPVVLDFLRRMIQHLPAGARLIIGSRNVPDLGLSRLRVRHQLLEIGPAQLRFSLEEAVALFRSRCHSLSDEEMRLLHQHTEGWAAALHLASLSLSSNGDHRELIANFSGSHASIADYLEEDVFAKLADELQTFLLCSCILSELCAPLCAAVTGNPRSGELLAQLERANLFLIPLDAERRQYRYHSLFADFLRARLKRCHPERVAGLHRAASRWYEADSRPVLAIGHAVEGEDTEQAVALLEKHAEDLLRRYRSSLLVRWYGALAPSVFDSRPGLRVAFAWALAFTHRGHEAIGLSERLSRPANEFPPDAGTRLSCMAIRALSLAMTDQLAACAETCDEGVPALRGPASFAGSMLACIRTLCLMAADKFDEAILMISEIRRQGAARVPALPHLTYANADGMQSLMDLIQGRLQEAQARMRRVVIDWMDDPGRELIPGAHAGVFLAELLYHSDELYEAERLLVEYLPLLSEHGMPDMLIVGYVTRARIAHARNDGAEALRILSDLEHLGHRLGLWRLVAAYWLERSRLALLEGDTAAAEAYWVCASNTEACRPLGSIVPYASDVDALEIGLLRLQIRSRRCEEAVPKIRQQLTMARDRSRHRRGLKLQILLAEALQGCGHTGAALEVLRDAVRFAGREGFVRTFAEEGATVARLLQTLRTTVSLDADDAAGAEVSFEFIDRLLCACGLEAREAALTVIVATPQEAAVRITRGEQRVLDLLAEGLSNAAIAQKLFLAPNTVNAHLRSISVKLGVRNRTQAVVVAQRQGLIASRA